jgi:hypothetical protein
VDFGRLVVAWFDAEDDLHQGEFAGKDPDGSTATPLPCSYPKGDLQVIKMCLLGLKANHKIIRLDGNDKDCLGTDC